MQRTAGEYDWRDMNERTLALEDVGTWSKIVNEDALGNPLDWDYIDMLDMEAGPARRDGDDAFADLTHAYNVRFRLERTLEAASKGWMFDRDRHIGDYRLVRALAWYSRRLNDLIDSLESAVPEGGRPSDPLTGYEESLKGARKHVWNTDWRDRYLPGRGIGEVVGIDLETTGLNAYRDYVIDAGWERMDMSGADMHDDAANAIYRVKGYKTDGAWDQERHTYGVSPLRMILGNPAESISGISASSLDGSRALDEDPAAQERLLQVLVSAPFVAHNAMFEHRHFMSTVAGYAEAYRDGRITIIDTMAMSMKWGHEDTGGNDRLETYAKRFGAMPDEGSERHLGLEDAHIMLVAMRNHLHALQSEGKGPWGPDGCPGTGGKTCR